MSKKEIAHIKLSFVREIKKLTEDSKQQVALTVNATMTMLYWPVGKRIKEEILKDKRAEYGKHRSLPHFQNN